jgi:hypothetical protein
MSSTIFLVGFFKFNKLNYGFERIHLAGIFKTEQEAREQMSFCDEAGFYEGALIEERRFGNQEFSHTKNRVWLIQQKDGSIKEIDESNEFKHIINLIG